MPGGCPSTPGGVLCACPASFPMRGSLFISRPVVSAGYPRFPACAADGPARTAPEGLVPLDTLPSPAGGTGAGYVRSSVLPCQVEK